MKVIIITILLTTLLLSHAYAVPITFQVNNFIGRYKINNGVDRAGNQTIDLAAGNHTFSAKFGGTTNFTVNNDGTVISADNTILSYSGATLTLNTLPIYFDIRNYSNKFTISNSPYQGTSGTFYLPVKLAVSIDVPGFNAIATLETDTNGNINIITGSDKLRGSKNKVYFKTVAVKVDPGYFNGIYAFNGGTYISGLTSHYFLPNTTYTIRTSTAFNIGNIQTNDTHLVPTTNASFRTLDDTVYLYSNEYTITPPPGYNGAWQIYQQGASNGAASKWLLPGAQSRLIVNNVVYNFTADSNCSSFNVSTAVGTFNFECNDEASLVHDYLSESNFNDIAKGYILNRTDGRLSTNINDYNLSINNISIILTQYFLTNDKLFVFDALSEGINMITLDGKDSYSNPFQINPTFWAGSSEVSVYTTGSTDTVNLTVEQTIAGMTYTKTITSQAVNHVVQFKNVPRIQDGNVDISTSRGRRATFSKKISKFEQIFL